MTASQQPETGDVLEKLDELLRTDGLPENVADVSTLDGLVAGALVGPQDVPLADLMAWVWDDEAGEAAPNRKSTELRPVLDEIAALVEQHWNDTAVLLQDDPDGYAPIIYAAETEGQGEVSGIDEWCWGFVRGMRLSGVEFEDLPDELQELVAPVFLYGTEEGWAQLEELNVTREQHETIAEALGAIVVALLAHYQG